ncbi:glycosyltransferase [Anaeromassilibacillus sp. SJQ-1]|uniref:glycosyltransferase n=1 Tax=Anaeromassilibacillus sp. SJQ-1 TaxID=3375419 RepID=UPI00128E958E|nr:glycosyltransferase family 2 protein [Clostridiales bacterium]
MGARVGRVKEQRQNRTFSKGPIIIPVYNVGQYVSECLDSVVNQTVVNMEIFV